MCTVPLMLYFGLIVIVFTSNCIGSGEIHFPKDDDNVDTQQYQINSKQPLAASPIIPKLPSVTPTYAPAFDPEPRNFNFITEFAWNLFKGSKLPNPVGNLALSPLMVELLLAEILPVTVGRTQEEISAVLKQANLQVLTKLLVDLQSQKKNKIDMASAIFVGQDLSLNQSFVTHARSRNVALITIDYNNPAQSASIANNWIANVTNNQIINLFEPQNLIGQRVLLTNTLFFRGSWKYVFTDIVQDQFYMTPTSAKSVTYMLQVSKLRANDFKLINGPIGKWVELPYQGNELSMIVIIPSIQHTLDDLIYQMIPQDITNIIQQLYDPYKLNVHLKMPKFDIHSTFSLVNVLLKLGIVNVFTINAQLPYLTTNQELLGINDVVQKTVLTVDEKGTVAASATSVSVVALSLSYTPENLVFYVDQPFLSIIVDKRNKIPILISKIYDP